jgi:hypothetical protein
LTRRRRKSTARALPLGPGVAWPLLAGVAHASLLQSQLPLLQQLPHWFWRATEAGRPLWWLILPLVGLHLLVIRRIWKAPERIALNLCLLIVLGFLTQQGFALMEGRGIDGMRDRLVHTGHGRFAWDAARLPSIATAVTDYRELIEEEEGTGSAPLPRYPYATKPPGVLLFFMLAERCSRVLPGSFENGFERLTTFAALAFPLLSYLVAVPLYFLSRMFLSGPAAWIPSLLLLSAPNLTLITLHLDQCLFPLLFVGAVWLFAWGLRSRRLLPAFTAGAATCVALYFSFSLVAIVPLLVLLAGLDAVRRRSLPDARFAALSVGALLVGLGLAVGLLAVLLDYGTLDTYRYAMANHQAWKIEAWTPGTYLYVGFLDLLEFALWTGITVSILAAYPAVRAALRARAEGLAGGGALAVATVGVVLLLAFLGKTVAETARLWLFLVPLVLLLAGLALGQRTGPGGRLAVMLVAVVQLLVTLATKLHQDFY